MTDRPDPRLFELFTHGRGRASRASLERLVERAAERSIPIRPADLWYLGDRSACEELCPPQVARFISALLSHEPDLKVLDPWVGLGGLLSSLIGPDGPQFVALSPNPQAQALASRLLVGGERGRFVLCDGTRSELPDLGTFDVVAGLLPFGLRQTSQTIDGTELTDAAEHFLLLRSARLLAPRGVGVFVVAPGAIFRRGTRTVLDNLGRFGLHVDAIFHFPSGTFAPLTQIETLAVVIRRGPAPPSVFAGEVSGDESRVQTLLTNYRRRRAATEPALGALVELENYRGLARLSVDRRLRAWARTNGLPLQRLGDLLAGEIRRCPLERGDQDQQPNSFYLPLVASSRIRLVAEQLPARRSDYLEIVLDPDRADARLVANFFESRLGRELRFAWSRGATLQRLRVEDVPELPIPVPDTATQTAMVQLDQRLRTLEIESQELRLRLWRDMGTVSVIREAAERLNLDDSESFARWLESLPYPLATILWRYHTQREGRDRLLLHFFEATTEFLAILLLSAARSDPSLFEAERGVLQRVLQEKKLPIEQATFGTWRIIFERLASTFRDGLATTDPEVARGWQRRLAAGDADFAEALVSTDMVQVLGEANALRNSWLGHAGAEGPSESRRKESVLKEKLIRFREIVGTRWGAHPIVLPGLSRFAEGSFHYQVRFAMGSRFPLRQGELEFPSPLEDGFMHMVTPDIGWTCRLLPLVRLGAPPLSEDSACYFFNRVDGPDVRFVSYHHEDRPEVTTPDERARAALRELSANLP